MTILRSGRTEDAAAVVELWRAADAEPTASDNPGAVERLIAHDPDALIVAEHEGQIVGTVVVGFDGWRGNLYRLAVHPQLRRSGIASDMVAEAERRLVGRGAPRSNALVVIEHQGATSFWEHVGYARDPRMGRHVKTL